jgi:centromeric protein E
MRKPHIPRPFKKPEQQTNNNNKSSSSSDSSLIYAWDVVSEDMITQSSQTDIILGRTHSYTLDKVYDPAANNLHVYKNSIQNLVHAAMDGFHTSVLAYGQTSTGKTFTMSGTPNQPGMIPLCVKECFNYLQQGQQDTREYLLRVSYLEVYKEVRQ